MKKTKKVDIYEIRKVATVEVPVDDSVIKWDGEIMKIRKIDIKEYRLPEFSFSDDYLRENVFKEDWCGSIAEIKRSTICDYRYQISPYEDPGPYSCSVVGIEYTARGNIAIHLKDVPWRIKDLLRRTFNQ